MRARNTRGAGHNGPASAVSGLYGPIGTCGYNGGYGSNGREPLLMGIIIIIAIVSMTCAIRCCYDHSDVVGSPWRCFRLHCAGQRCSELPAGDIDRCAGLKIIWCGSRCGGPKVLGRIPWTTRTLKWQSQDTGREFPACGPARPSPKKVWLNRKYVYKEHIDHHQGEIPSVHHW